MNKFSYLIVLIACIAFIWMGITISSLKQEINDIKKGEGKKGNEYYTINSLETPQNYNISSSTPPIYTPVEDIFARVARTKEVVPTNDEIKQKYTTCISTPGNTIKGCLIESNAGVDNNTCKEMCQLSVNPLSTYCTRVCSELMTSQRNSCASGMC